MTDREAYKAALLRKPVFQISTAEARIFNPSVIPDVIARGFVMEAGNPFPRGGGGKDMFGVEWIYDAVAGGSTVLPGNPMLEDMNDWEKVLVWPDVDAWDWEESARRNRDFLTPDKYNIMPFMNGWFERLISLMDFSGGILALADEDQTDAVHAFFDKLTDTYIKIFDHCIQAYPLLDGFWVHDDWGGKQDTFFSPDVCGEMIVPYMRRVTDFLHSKGKFCDFHSCGNNYRQIPNMLAAGWDSWTPQEDVNDTAKIYETYGDQLMIGVTYNWPEPGASEEEQLQAVDDFVEKFCKPWKPCILNDRKQPGITQFIRRELKERSAKRFAAV